MKTILLITALCLATMGGYAQNKMCVYKHKSANHHKVASRHKTRNKVSQPVAATKTENITVQEAPCFTYRKGDIVVSECPDIFYDNEGHATYSANPADLEFKTESQYSGYYPKPESQQVQQPAETTPAYPPNTELNQGTYNYMCFWGCRK